MYPVKSEQLSTNVKTSKIAGKNYRVVGKKITRGGSVHGIVAVPGTKVRVSVRGECAGHELWPFTQFSNLRYDTWYLLRLK